MEGIKISIFSEIFKTLRVDKILLLYTKHNTLWFQEGEFKQT